MMKSIILASALAAVSMGVQAGDFYVLGDVGQSKIEISLDDDYSVSKSDTMIPTTKTGHWFNLQTSPQTAQEFDSQLHCDVVVDCSPLRYIQK